MALIDFHTHILPGIDDGSRDEAMTEAMLLEEARQGVELVVATPHFYANRMSVDSFLLRREKALEKAQSIRARRGDLPELLVGAEVCYFPGIGRATEIDKLCIGQSRTLLLEMPFVQWSEAVLRDVKDLTSGQGLNLVLAHIERYPEFQRRKDVWNRVLDLGLTFQLNAGSFLKRGLLSGGNGRRKFCLDFLSKRPDSIIGSDCHNLSVRRPNLAEGRGEIAAKLGAGALERLDRAAMRALGL